MRAILFVMLAGCVRPAAFACDDDGQCTRGNERGTCEINGRCSFADRDCESGRRFGELSGDQGGECVGETGDAGVDAIALPNEPIADAPPACPGFTPAGGRYYKRLAAAGWTNQRTACGMIVGNVYLAVPDDADELAAIVDVAGGDVWLGISDASTEGAYVSVHGNDATFLPWAANEPDNSGNQDCVRSKGTAIETAVCGAPTAAVCECTP